MSREIYDSADVSPTHRVSPVKRMLDQIDGDYKTYREVAAELGIHTQTLRRLCKATMDDGQPVVNAPSKAMKQRGLVIYLFSPEDIDEVRKHYFGDKPVDL